MKEPNSGTGFDGGSNGEIGHERVLGLARTVRDDIAPPGLPAKLDGPFRLAHRADLVELDQNGVGGLLFDAAFNEGGVSHEDVVADDLNAIALSRRLRRETRPIVLVEPVFNGNNRKASSQRP